MFGKPVNLFELLGFKVKADASWLFLVLLVTWSLAKGFFPALYPGWATTTYWHMALVGMLGLCVSLILHELSHAVVARRFGLRIKGITLFLFGGVAEMEEEPESPKAEFLVAIAGPIASFALAAANLLLFWAAGSAGLPTPVLGVFYYLFFINGLLAVFNLIPAFPLDGGRAFRAALWHWKHDLRWATRVAAGSGQVFGILLIFLGVFFVLTGNFIGGMWWFLIGLFLRGAAGASYYQVLTRRAFEGVPVRRFMTRDPVTVPPTITVRELVDDYVYRHHYDLFPVVSGDRVLGLVSTKQVKQMPHEAWDRARVADILVPSSPENTIDPATDAVAALSIMRRSGNGRLLVVEQGRLVGVIALKDMLEFLALKMDLERE